MINQILQMLPQRYPFLMIDQIIELVDGESVTALKNITINEPCFQGHFPDFPIYPGVMLIESMAQTTAIIRFSDLTCPQNQDKVFYLAGVNGARFKQQVRPGDQVIFKSHFIKCSQNISKFSCEGLVSGKQVCKAEILCALSDKAPLIENNT